MKRNNHKKIIDRMNYLAGHLNGVIKMIQGDRYCIDIIRQNQAVVAAIEKVNEMILKNHLETCVTRAVKSRNKKDRTRVFKEIVEVFKEKR